MTYDSHYTEYISHQKMNILKYMGDYIHFQKLLKGSDGISYIRESSMCMRDYKLPKLHR